MKPWMCWALMATAGIAVITGLGGCMTMGGEPLNMISTEQEIQLGKEVSTEIEKEEKLLNNPAIQSYVADVGWRMAHVSPRQDVTYGFKVIDAPDTVNAFALPGGYMYIYTGLMKLCENEAELAAVMAHEIGHVAAHHHGESMTRQYGISLITSVLLGQNPNALAQMAAGMIGQVGMMRFSRLNEQEADMLGMEMLFRAGYPPDAMITFMQKMLAEEQKNGGGTWLPIFSSHPPTQERLLYLQALVQKYPPEMRNASSTQAERYRDKVLKAL